jgi:hypothetical protein
MGFVADVFDALLRDKATGEIFATTTLTEANINVEVQKNDIRAGKGNNRLGTLHTSRDITVEMTDVSFKYDFLARQLGQEIVTGAGVAYAFPKFYSVEDSSGQLQITLDKPVSAADPALALFTADGQKITGATVSGNVVNLSGASPTLSAGQDVEVRTYKYDTDPQTKLIKIDNSVFAKGVELILQTYEIDGEENILNIIQWQFPNAVPQGNFTVNTQSERNAVSSSFNLDIIKPKDSTVVGEILLIPYNE